MTIYETIIHMLTTGENEDLRVSEITIASDRYDSLLADLAYKYGWGLTRNEGSLQLYGPRGPVTIRRGA